MTKYKLFIAIAAWIICGIIASLIQAPKSIDAQNLDTPDLQVKRAAFQKIRGQLEVKGVSFDPDILLEPTWREQLNLVLDAIPEMHEKRILGQTIKGVQMAETLYLPENVRLTGDTLLLAKTIIFEGNNVLIKGNYNVYFMPLEMDGALGTSLESAMRTGLGRNAEPGIPEMLSEFQPKLIQENYSLTIDASGLTYEEFLKIRDEEQALNEILSPEDADTCPPNQSCTPIQDLFPPPGPEGSPTPDEAAPAQTPENDLPPFSCPRANGYAGGNGYNGVNAGYPFSSVGNTGGPGNQGLPGKTIQASIYSLTGTYTFTSTGGQGGQGGQGGLGQRGGVGGRGDNGQNGKDCPCSPAPGGRGSGGNAGDGGTGGTGGKGGKGGPGGIGGTGGQITVRHEPNFTGTINPTAPGGIGGVGGSRGIVGPGGNKGAQGNPGLKATPANGQNFQCADVPNNWADGGYEYNAGVANVGEPGDLGDDSTATGSPGPTPVVTACPSTTPPKEIHLTQMLTGPAA